MDFLISYRFQHGLKTQKFSPGADDLTDLGRDDTGGCRCMAYSQTGDLFAHCNSSAVKLRRLDNPKQQPFDLPHPKTAHMIFSPRGSVLAVWEQFYTTVDNPQGSPNLNLYCTSSGALLKGFVQKKAESWKPSWLEDDSVCARDVTGEVHFYAGGDFSKMQCRLSLAGLTAYSLAQSKENPHVAAYIPGKRGQPSSVRLFRYPNFSSPVSNKSFYKAERVNFFWNQRGTDLLVLTACEVSQESYYGEQGLHFISVRGESCVVQLQKQGPIYNIEWHPSSTEFVVTHGYMPAKTTVYNLRCEPTFDFGTGPRNVTHFNPFGNIMCLAGFGNLKGDVELWDYKNKKIMAKFMVPDATQFEWCPDGEHFMAATTSPRLRVNNCLAVFHYSGKQLLRKEFECLLEVAWRPMPDCKAPTLHYDASRTYQSVAQSTMPSRYVPPHMRNKSAAAAAGGKSAVRSNYEPPSNQRPDSSQPMSKAAIKNQKKKERKRANEADKSEQPQQQQSQALQNFQSTGDDEKDKRAKNILRKLGQIDRLKADQDGGRQLELNQLEKLKTEDALRDELAKLYV